MSARTHVQAIVCAAVAVVAARAAAQERAISLAETLRALFEESPAFRVYAEQTRAANGARLRTAGAFDLVATTALQGTRALWLAPSGTGILGDQGYQDLTLQAGLALRTRVNVTMQLSGSLPLVSSVDALGSPDQPQLGASLTIPLLKLGSSAAAGAEERASAVHAAATIELQRDAESELAARVAESYWRWVGSYEQLKWARRLEALARDQLGDVEQLIAQRARAAADRLAFAAAAENATASRVQAEQAMIDEQQQLYQSLGLPAPTSRAAPAVELPIVPPDALDGAAIAGRAHAQATSRPLLRSVDDELSASQIRNRAARIAKRPDLALVGQAIVTRVQDTASAASMSADASSSAATQTKLGYYGSVALQLSWPLQNRTARGAAEEASANERQLALAKTQRRNVIDVSIDNLSGALGALSRTYQGRVKAAEQFRLSYEAQRTRFRLGTATAMDVVIAEQQYMSASLATIADRVAYAVTLARLAHEAGVLGAAVQSRDAVAAARLLAAPRF